MSHYCFFYTCPTTGFMLVPSYSQSSHIALLVVICIMYPSSAHTWRLLLPVRHVLYLERYSNSSPCSLRPPTVALPRNGILPPRSVSALGRNATPVRSRRPWWQTFFARGLPPMPHAATPSVSDQLSTRVLLHLLVDDALQQQQERLSVSSASAARD